MLKKGMAHLAIILSGMYAVFFGIDRVNSGMCFIDNTGTKLLILVLAVIAVIESILLISEERRKERRMARRARHAAREE